MRQLLEAGIHFGHQTRRWNPKMQRYIFGQRNGIYIIDLQKTMRQLQEAYAAVRDAVAAGGSVLFVGTKKQAQEASRREAERCSMYYVNTRWLGGTLTNWQTIRKSVQALLDLEEMETSGKIEQYSKKEGIQMRKRRERLEKSLSGIKTMPGLPQVVFAIDAKKEAIAVREAKRLGIVSIGVVDTNCDPDEVDIPIPGNDDALRAVGLFCSVIADAVLDGRMLAEKRQFEPARGRRAEEPAPVAVVETLDTLAGDEEVTADAGGDTDWRE
jgi:small subunit ribosomal protein S2